MNEMQKDNVGNRGDRPTSILFWVAALISVAVSGVLALPQYALGAELSLSVLGPPETVFSWKHDRCSQYNYPDSPARAVRGPGSQVSLFATHYSNIPLVGKDFNHLKPACGISLSGAEKMDPEAQDDRFWIQAVARRPDGKYIALASHEYMGKRHGTCSASVGTCWYSSITALVGGADLRFKPLERTTRVVARSPHPFDPNLNVPTGFFTASNIFQHQGDAYVFLNVRGIKGQRDGNCLFKASDAQKMVSWKPVNRLPNEKTIAPKASDVQNLVCDVIGENVFPGSIRSVVYFAPERKWVAVFTISDFNRRKYKLSPGVYFSVSSNLFDWNSPKLISKMDIWAEQKTPGTYFEYPSIIDFNSGGENFDRVQRNPYLLMTRYNFFPDRRRGDDRDLVRIPLEINVQ